MKKWILLVLPLAAAAAFLIWISSTFADTTAGSVTCTTRSKGVSFQESGSNAGVARMAVIKDCEKSPGSFWGQCDYNSECSNDASGGWIRCKTNSNGMVFEDADENQKIAQVKTIRNCAKHEGSDSSECSQNVSCDSSLTFS